MEHRSIDLYNGTAIVVDIPTKGSDAPMKNSDSALMILDDKIQKLQADNKRYKDLIKELLESAEYWSEYDVPIGIVDRMREAVKDEK